MALLTPLAAQPLPPAGAASGVSPSERARHDADKVYQMILQHADKPVRAANTSTPPVRATATPPSEEVPATRIVPNALAPRAQPLADLAPVGAVTPIEAAASLSSAAMPALTGSTKLELLSSVEPQFPIGLVRKIGAGSVVVSFDVRADGSVARADVERTVHRGLNDAAVAAVSAWRFKPIAGPATGVVELKFE